MPFGNLAQNTVFVFDVGVSQFRDHDRLQIEIGITLFQDLHPAFLVIRQKKTGARPASLTNLVIRIVQGTLKPAHTSSLCSSLQTCRRLYGTGSHFSRGIAHRPTDNVRGSILLIFCVTGPDIEGICARPGILADQHGAYCRQHVLVGHRRKRTHSGQVIPLV